MCICDVFVVVLSYSCVYLFVCLVILWCFGVLSVCFLCGLCVGWETFRCNVGGLFVLVGCVVGVVWCVVCVFFVWIVYWF